MAFRVRITIAFTLLVAALGWGLFIKAYMSRSAWREQAVAASQRILDEQALAASKRVPPEQAAGVTELAPACVAPNQLLNFNLKQVNDIRLNLQVGVQKLTDVMTSIQEKSRELSGLEAHRQKLTADVALLDEQIQAKRIALAQPADPAAEVQPLTPSRACP